METVGRPARLDGHQETSGFLLVRQNISIWLRIGFQNSISSGRCSRRDCIG